MVQTRKAGNSPVSQPSQPIPEPVPPNSTVYVNGKPVADDARTSGATKEAAASKTAEQKLAGQAQEVWLREQLRLKSSHQPSELDDKVHAPNMWTATADDSNVQINDRPTHRKDDSDCDDSKKPQGGKAKP